MTPFETVRALVAGHLATFHTTSYSSLKVDYPSHYVVDPETDTEFVRVEISLSSNLMDLSARRAFRITGRVYSTHYKRKGSASFKGFLAYTDLLTTYLGMSTIGGVTYKEVKPYTSAGLPGFDGMMNVVEFHYNYIA
jgi:hypothetical protein